MRYVGRIITNTKIDDISEFIEVTKDSSSIVHNDTKIPTLIVGYENTKKICGNVNITRKEIGKNLSWTFSKRERRIDYEDDLEKFVMTVSNFVLNHCDFEYVDFLTANEEKKLCVVNMLNDIGYRKIVYETNTMFYIYVPHDNKVYGISREILKFCGVDESMINGEENRSITTFTDSEFSETKIAKKRFVIPLLYYLMTF